MCLKIKLREKYKLKKYKTEKLRKIELISEIWTKKKKKEKQFLNIIRNNLRNEQFNEF